MKNLILVIGLKAALIAFFLLSATGYSSEIAWTAAVVVVCAIWWIFEPVPIPVTSLWLRN
jgi:sodium-dependent dicarboxylate transporter 2/3/5